MLLSIALALTSLTTSFDVSGVHVVLRQNDANNVVAANLYLLGGARQVGEANAGIEPILLDVSERGTQRYPKNALRRAMSMLGSEIVVAPSADWTMFGIRSSTEVFDSTWAIFADRVMHPTLAKAEINVVKAQYLSGINQRRDDPDALVDYLADSITYVGHPYAVSVVGNEKSIPAIDSASLRDYQQKQFVTSRMLLVVVGNVDRAHIERLVSQSIGKLPRGTYAWTPPPRVPDASTAVVIERRQLPTNYILGYYSGPLANGADYQALRVATSVLTGRMFAEIRTRQNLTYDVHAPFVDRAATTGGLYVSTVSPDTTMKLMRAAVADLQSGMLDPIGLKQLEEQFITEYFLDNETNAAQADFLARSQLYEGDYREADRFVDELKSVTPEAVQRVAR
jgi:zinc protease